MQPAGKPAPPTHSFPSTKAHFDLLRSLDPKKARIKGLNLHTTIFSTREIVGVELIFSNGQSILLGAEEIILSSSTSSAKSSRFLLKKTKNEHYGKFSRFVSFYDDKNQEIGYTSFYDPLYEEVPKQRIPDGYELIECQSRSKVESFGPTFFSGPLLRL